eukprot:UN21709
MCHSHRQNPIQPFSSGRQAHNGSMQGTHAHVSQPSMSGNPGIACSPSGHSHIGSGHGTHSHVSQPSTKPHSTFSSGRQAHNGGNVKGRWGKLSKTNN